MVEPRIAALLAAFLTLSLPAPVLSAQQPTRQASALEAGSVENGTYRNKIFGFQYKVPFDWVERTEQMRGDSGDTSRSLLLLAVFERPPEATGDSINSAVVITAESTETYPGLKTAADYFAPLSDVATGKGFQVVNEPYYFNVGAKRLVRGDFSKKIGQVTMYQSSLVVMEKSYFVSFTFLGGSEDEIDERIENLSFSPATARSRQGRK